MHIDRVRPRPLGRGRAHRRGTLPATEEEERRASSHRSQRELVGGHACTPYTHVPQRALSATAPPPSSMPLPGAVAPLRSGRQRLLSLSALSQDHPPGLLSVRQRPRLASPTALRSCAAILIVRLLAAPFPSFPSPASSTSSVSRCVRCRYDLTKYLARHPGGDVLLEFAGRDATAQFVAYHSDSVLKHWKPVGTYK